MGKSIKSIAPLILIVLITCLSFSEYRTVNKDSEILGGWTKLGKQTVGEGARFDEMLFAEEKSNVKRLKLKVAKSSVYLVSIKVSYTDGTSESHIVSRRLDKGDTTRVFDLIGHHRIIEKIIFVYRSDANKGGAQLIVLGKM